MGCCVSSATVDDPVVSDKNTSPPPSVVEEKTVVNEVLSTKTTLLTNNNNSTMEKILEDDEEEKKKPGAQDPVLTKPGSVKPEIGTEASSLSESLLSIVNGYDEEQVKQKIPQIVRQRSPAKSRNRVMVGGAYPTRRTDMSPRKRNNGGDGYRDPSERSERRSRSPAMNRSVVSNGGGASTRRQSQSPGRVRRDPSQNGSEQECNKWPGGSEARNDYDSTPNDSFENPLVSLECFIFL